MQIMNKSQAFSEQSGAEADFSNIPIAKFANKLADFQVKSLILNNCGLRSFSEIPLIPLLESLNCNKNVITQLDISEKFAYLKSISVENNRIASFQNCAQLISLQELNIKGNAFSGPLISSLQLIATAIFPNLRLLDGQDVRTVAESNGWTRAPRYAALNYLMISGTKAKTVDLSPNNGHAREVSLQTDRSVHIARLENGKIVISGQLKFSCKVVQTAFGIPFIFDDRLVPGLTTLYLITLHEQKFIVVDGQECNINQLVFSCTNSNPLNFFSVAVNTSHKLEFGPQSNLIILGKRAESLELLETSRVQLQGHQLKLSFKEKRHNQIYNFTIPSSLLDEQEYYEYLLLNALADQLQPEQRKQLLNRQCGQLSTCYSTDTITDILQQFLGNTGVLQEVVADLQKQEQSITTVSDALLYLQEEHLKIKSYQLDFTEMQSNQQRLYQESQENEKLRKLVEELNSELKNIKQDKDFFAQTNRFAKIGEKDKDNAIAQLQKEALENQEKNKVFSEGYQLLLSRYKQVINLNNRNKEQILEYQQQLQDGARQVDILQLEIDRYSSEMQVLRLNNNDLKQAKRDIQGQNYILQQDYNNVLLQLNNLQSQIISSHQDDIVPNLMKDVQLKSAQLNSLENESLVIKEQFSVLQQKIQEQEKTSKQRIQQLHDDNQKLSEQLTNTHNSLSEQQLAESKREISAQNQQTELDFLKQETGKYKAVYQMVKAALKCDFDEVSEKLSDMYNDYLRLKSQLKKQAQPEQNVDEDHHEASDCFQNASDKQLDSLLEGKNRELAQLQLENGRQDELIEKYHQQLESQHVALELIEKNYKKQLLEQMRLQKQLGSEIQLMKSQGFKEQVEEQQQIIVKLREACGLQAARLEEMEQRFRQQFAETAEVGTLTEGDVEEQLQVLKNLLTEKCQEAVQLQAQIDTVEAKQQSLGKANGELAARCDDLQTKLQEARNTLETTQTQIQQQQASVSAIAVPPSIPPPVPEERVAQSVQLLQQSPEAAVPVTVIQDGSSNLQVSESKSESNTKGNDEAAPVKENPNADFVNAILRESGEPANRAPEGEPDQQFGELPPAPENGYDEVQANDEQ